MKGYPARWIVYDTETDERPVLGVPGSRELVFRLGYMVYRESWEGRVTRGWDFGFRTTDEFHARLHTLGRTDVPIYIFAHNHGFDVRTVGFLHEASSGRYGLVPPVGTHRAATYRHPLFIVDGPPFLCRLWREDGQQLMLLDTLNWLDMGLRQIGLLLGVPKGEVDFRAVDDETLMRHCQRDVEITALALERIWGFCRSIGVKDWQPTLASQAHRSFQRKYARKNIKMPEDHSLLALDRHAYYGGRTECFRLGRIDGPIVQADVNSMYPSLMRDGLFPVEILAYEHNPKAKTSGAPEGPAQTTAEVWLDSPDHAYPVRCREGTWYVRGKVRTILCGPELRAACERNHVSAYGRWTRYRLSRVFAEFVRDLWTVRMDARARGDKCAATLAKLYMNALYGKFGQRAGEWSTGQEIGDPGSFAGGVIYDAANDRVGHCRLINGIYQRKFDDALADHAFVPIAAYVTSYGRVFMDSVRSKLWDGGLYYQSTDSLLMDMENWDLLQAAGLCREGELGHFRREDTYEWVDVRNLYHVERPRRPIRGGLPSTASEFTDGIFQWDKWQGPWTGICRGRDSSVLIRQTLTRLRDTYSRQFVLTSGHCRPWVICNWRATPDDQRKGSLDLSGDQGR